MKLIARHTGIAHAVTGIGAYLIAFALWSHTRIGAIIALIAINTIGGAIIGASRPTPPDTNTPGLNYTPKDPGYFR